MTLLRRPHCALAVLFASQIAAIGTDARAAISYTTDGAIYTQNFDSLPSTPVNTSLGNTPLGWINDRTDPDAGNFSIPGIYVTHPNVATEGGRIGHSRMRIGSGNSNVGAFMTYGADGSTDRALGMLSSATLANPNVASYYGAYFYNDTGHRLDQFTLSYTGEQWRDGGATTPVAQTTFFDIMVSRVNYSYIDEGGFGNVAALAFTSPVFGAQTGIALDGNLPANRTQIGPVTVKGINWDAGNFLWIRWRDPNDSGNDHGLAIDDLSFSATASAPTHVYTRIDFPDLFSRWTFANGISPAGDVVGEYDNGGTTHAFIRTAAGAGSSFDHPTAVGYTSANGMNSSGQVVGLYSLDNQATMRAYLRTGNTYLDLVPRPASTFTQASSINDTGHVVGSFLDANNNPQGFLFDGTTYTTLSHPDATLTVALGINNSEVVVGNAVINGGAHGFLYQNGAFTTFEMPGARETVAEGINDAGQIVGLYTDTQGLDHGFLLENGVYTSLDYPNASRTWGYAINNSGQIVGQYDDSRGDAHGFLATPMKAADFDNDGDVDAGDLAAWTANVGKSPAARSDGDADLDGDVDGGDLVIWQRQFKPAPGALPASTGVPEPGGLALIGLSSVFLATLRRQSK